MRENIEMKVANVMGELFVTAQILQAKLREKYKTDAIHLLTKNPSRPKTGPRFLPCYCEGQLLKKGKTLNQKKLVGFHGWLKEELERLKELEGKLV